MKNFLDYASKRYYEGTPILSDAEFDHLADTYAFQEVGYTITDGVPHLHRMYSLQKVFSEEDLPSDIETYIPATEIWEEISTLWPQSELAMSQPSAQGLPEFLEVLKQTQNLSKQYSPTSNPDWWLSSTKPEAFTLRMQVAKEAYNIIEKYPEFWYIWNGVFIKLYNNDTEQLQYIGDMRDTR